MTAQCHILKQRQHRRGFTLVEIMVVMIIVSLLLILSLNVSSSWKSQKLASQALQLASEFARVSLLAQKDNYPVEIRFYLLPDEFGGGSATAPRAYQLAKLTGYDTQGQAITRMLESVQYFEDDIILHETPTYTSMMALPVHTPATDDPIVRGEKRSYVSFLFLPDGRTSLPRHPDAVFTLVKESESQRAATGELPPNFRSVTLQPVTGKATTY